MRRFERGAGGKPEFWEIEVAGKVVTTRAGRIGTAGKTQVYPFSATAVARHKEYVRVTAKLRAGFIEVVGTMPVPRPVLVHPRNPALEARIRAHRADAGAVSVYADWLQGQGSPAGELIALEHDGPPRGAHKRRATALRKLLELPAEDLATTGTRFGMWQWLRLENAVDWMDNEFDAVGLAAPLFAQPMCAALEELRIGILRWDSNEQDVPAVIAAAGKHAWAAELERLHLGDVGDDVDMAHHVIGKIGKPISKTFPRLRWLKLHSGEQTWHGPNTFELDGLDLPELETLIIETCAMSKKRLRHVLGAKLPKLTALELWFGDEDADATLRDLAPLLDGRVFPRVRSLGLRNATFTDPLCTALGALAPRLEALDLSLGVMSDAGAEALLSRAPSFKQLVTLAVDDSYLSPTAVRALEAAFPRATVTAADQKTADAGAPDRYVTVGE